MIKQLNIKQWRKHQKQDYITTNSRWLSTLSDKPIFGNFKIPKRNFLPKPSGDHHGIWISEIPYQMILRFTNINDKIWSQFGGSGVDYQVARLLQRTCYINDIVPKQQYIIEADSREYKTPEKVDMILSHPPYWDIIKYSDDIRDGSTKESLLTFLIWWKQIVLNSINNLKNNGYFILACGNIYKNKQQIQLGNLCLNILLANGFILKQHIIKDYGQTKGKEFKNYNLNYYRQLKGKYGNFYGDNIYVLKYTKSKNNIIQYLKEVL